MTTLEDQIRAIRCDPDADAPRLGCADWLISRGDARGEFIALDCRLARVARENPERESLVQFRNSFTLETWRAPLLAHGAQGEKRDAVLQFERGFIERVTLAGRSTARFAELCRLEPILDLTLASPGPRNYAAIAEMPELAQVRTLAIDGKYMEGSATLLASPLLRNLRHLRLPFLIEMNAIEALISSGNRPYVSGGVTGAALALLMKAGLYEIDIGRTLYLTHADEDLVLEIAKRPLTELRDLQLRESRVTERTFAALGARLDQLERLALELTPFSREMAIEMIRHMPSGNLRYLQHSGEGGSEGLDMFIASPAFRNVVELDLRYGPFNEVELERSPYRGKLRKLSVGWGKPWYGMRSLPGVEIDVFDEGW